MKLMIKKILIMSLLICSSVALAEEVALYRDSDLSLPKEFDRSYRSYWENVSSQSFDAILMADDYMPQAKLDYRITKAYAKGKKFSIRPVFFKSIKKENGGELFLISADFLDAKDKSVLHATTGCHVVRKEGQRIRYVSYLGDCLSFPQ